MSTRCSPGIDFVVMWVDMDDPAWREQFSRYAGRVDNSRNEVSEARFRDYGFMRYWFRGVEKFAPWVGRVHFVTCGQKPEWLDASNPRLRLVDHRDFIPAEFLPTFNSGVIESWLHRVPGLAEKFVFFNDDFFLTRATPPERFFRDGLPCDVARLRFNSGGGQWARMLQNNVRLVNRHFRTPWAMRTFPKWTAYRTPHNAQPYLKSTFEEVWKACGAELSGNSTHRFRTAEDLTQELFRMWQICGDRFVPYNVYEDTKFFPLVLRSGAAIKALNEQKYRLVCLNDNVHIPHYGRVMEELRAGFEKILPEKSSFEL